MRRLTSDTASTFGIDRGVLRVGRGRRRERDRPRRARARRCPSTATTSRTAPAASRRAPAATTTRSWPARCSWTTASTPARSPATSLRADRRRSIAPRSTWTRSPFTDSSTTDEGPIRGASPSCARLCSGLGALFGGCGLGASLAVLEHVTGRAAPSGPPRSSSSSPVRPTSSSSRSPRSSAATPPARPASSRHVGGQEIFTVLAALGRRDAPVGGRVGRATRRAPARRRARPRPLRPDHAGTIAERIEVRAGEPAAARGSRRHPRHTAAARCGSATRGAPTRRPRRSRSSATSFRWGSARPVGGGWSRTASTTPCAWSRCIPPSGSSPTSVCTRSPTGFGHGLVHLWAEDGTLLATASQSTIVRDLRNLATTHERAGDRPMSVPRRYGVTVPFGSLPLHEHKALYEELVALGYTDLWSAEAGGHEGLVPLALAAAWTPTLRLGTAILPVYTRGAATLAEATASMCQAAPGRFALGIGCSSPTIVENWNAVPFEKPYQRVRDTIRFLRAALSGREGHRRVRDVLGARASASTSPCPRCRRSSSGRCAAGMLRLAGREGDGAITNWLLPRRRPEDRRAGRGRQGDRRAASWCCPTTDFDTVRAVGRRMVAAYLTVPAYAAFQEWLGRGDAIREMNETWSAGDRAGALELVPDTLIDELIVHGTPEECRRRRRGVRRPPASPPPRPRSSPQGDELRAMLRALAPQPDRSGATARSCARRRTKRAQVRTRIPHHARSIWHQRRENRADVGPVVVVVVQTLTTGERARGASRWWPSSRWDDGRACGRSRSLLRSDPR